MTYDIHRNDRKILDSYVLALEIERGRALNVPITQLEKDTAAYWRMIENYRRGGCPEHRLPRDFGTFTLPEGVNP